MPKKVKKQRGVQTAAGWGILVIARCSGMLQKCQVKNLAQARKVKYQTVWEEKEEYSASADMLPPKINTDVSI